MKKIIFLFVYLMVTFVQKVSAQSIDEQYIYLTHNGGVTLFQRSKLQDALDAAVKGDTVVLSAGTFGDATLKTAITVIGTGIDTSMGTIKVDIPNSPSLTSTLLRNVKVKELSVNATVKNLMLYRCEISNLKLNSNAENAVVTNCKINVLGDSDKTVNVINSCILGQNGYNWSNAMKFLNCNIYFPDREYYWPSTLSCQMINCIVLIDLGAVYYDDDTMAINCLIKIKDTPRNSTNCYDDNFKYDLDTGGFYFTEVEGMMTKEALESKGYYGIDGTVVGIDGGEYPYSLDTTYPKFLEDKIVVDNEKEIVQIKIKLSTN